MESNLTHAKYMLKLSLLCLISYFRAENIIFSVGFTELFFPNFIIVTIMVEHHCQTQIHISCTGYGYPSVSNIISSPLERHVQQAFDFLSCRPRGDD